jgi:hypothetical protein
VIGCICWLVVAVLLYLATARAFTIVTGRDRYRGRRFTPPPQPRPVRSSFPASREVLDAIPILDAEPLDVLPVEKDDADQKAIVEKPYPPGG